MLVLGYAASSWAQAPQRKRENALRLHAVARSIPSPVNGPTGLHWVPDPFPAEGDVLVPDAPLAQKLNETLAALAQDATCKNAWVLERNQPCSLGAAIQRRLGDFMFVFVANTNLLDAPEAAGGTQDVTLRADYVMPTVTQSESIGAAVSTENVNLGMVSTTTLSVTDVLARLGAAASAPGIPGTETIQINLSELDRKRPAGAADFPLKTLEDELFRVGLNALKIAADGGLALGQPAPNDRTLTVIDDKIREVYLVERPAWPAAVKTTRDAGKYVIEIKSLRFVSRVEAQVHRGQIPGENGPTDFVASTDAGERKIVETLKMASQEIRTFMESNGTGLEGTIPTRQTMLAAVETLRKFPKGEPPFDVSATGGTVVLQTTYKWITATIDAKVDLQVGYDAQQLFTGGGSVQGHNLLGTLLHRDLREDWDFSANGGPEAQHATLNLNLKRERGSFHRITFGTNFLAHASRDRNQRMGNLPVPGENDEDSQLIDKEAGLEPRVFLQHDVGVRWRSRARVEQSLDWRRVLVRPQLDSLPAAADGQLTAWVTSFSEMVGHDFTPAGVEMPGGGFSDVVFSVEGELRYATEALGGDFSFNRHQYSVTGEALLGWSARRQLLVRNVFGDASASVGTPLFQLFRLGGAKNIRGIEEGEFVGRSLRWNQATVGIALPVFIPSLNSAEGQLGALANTFIEVFYDPGYVAHPGRQSATGYGVGAEIRALPAGNRSANITLGWAKSSQSVLHRRGLMTLGVNFHF